MVLQCYVEAEPFWLAISHCTSPLYLACGVQIDLRFLASSQRETVLPSAPSESTALELQFEGKQDYIRFVLAYVLAERN